MKDLTADINVRGLDQWTSLHFAANENKIDVVNELLSHPEIEKDCLSSICRSPLHLAAIRGNIAIMRLLIKAGCDKNIKDFDENTPLHYTSEYGNVDCIIYLIKEAMVDTNIKNKFGYQPSDIA